MGLRKPFDKRKHRKFKKEPKPGIFVSSVNSLTGVARQVIGVGKSTGQVSTRELLDVYKLDSDLMISLIPQTPRHIFGIDLNEQGLDVPSDTLSALILQEYNSGKRI